MGAWKAWVAPGPPVKAAASRSRPLSVAPADGRAIIISIMIMIVTSVIDRVVRVIITNIIIIIMNCLIVMISMIISSFGRRLGRVAHARVGRRRNGVNTNGAAAQVVNADRLGKKVRPCTFAKIKLVKNH